MAIFVKKKRKILFFGTFLEFLATQFFTITGPYQP